MNPRNTHPSTDSAKECTEGVGPPRLMNIPRRDEVNATFINAMFHTLNMPRLFCTMME